MKVITWLLVVTHMFLQTHSVQANTAVKSGKYQVVFVCTDGRDLLPASTVQRQLRPLVQRHGQIISSMTVRSALRRLHTTSAALKSPKMAIKVAHLLHASLVVVVERTAKNGYPGLAVTVVPTTKQQTISRRVFPFTKQHLAASSVQRLKQLFTNYLPSTGHQTKSLPSHLANNQPETSMQGVLDNKDPTIPQPSISHEPVKNHASKTTAVEAAAASIPAKLSRRPPGLRLEIGLSLLQRNATIDGANIPAGVILPCFCGTSRNANPFVPGFSLESTFFPGAYHDQSAKPYQSRSSNAGLFMGGFITEVTSFLAQSANQAIAAPGTLKLKSLVGTLHSAAIYRFWFGNSRQSLSLTPELGLIVYGFSLTNSPFPAALNLSPEIGVNFAAPLATEIVSLLFNVHYLLAMGTSAQAAALLGKTLLGQGLWLEGGLRFLFAHYFELSIKSKFELYVSRYKGMTNLTDNSGNNLGITNAMLVDKNVYISFNAGFVY